jgi:tetratricopeptide (TPR) repeat protein
MVQQYLLPCECGQANQVTAAQAGRLLTCACGREQKVPTFSALRQLAPAISRADVAAGRSQRGRSFGIWSLALGIAALLGTVVFGVWRFARGWVPTPELPAIDVSRVEPEVRDAVEAARAAVEHSPRSAAAWGQLAMVLHGNALEKSADVCYAAAAELDPMNPDWPYLRGYMHQDGAGGPEMAIPLYRQAASLSAARSMARVRLAEMLLAQGSLEEADDEFKRVLSADPGNADALVGRAAVEAARQHFTEAREMLESLSEHPQVQKRVCELLASVYERLGDTAAAEEQRRRLKSLPEDPSQPDDAMHRVGKLQTGLAARLRKSNMLRQQQRFVEALAEIRGAVARYPESDEAWSNLGAALHHQQDPEGAEDAMRKCIALAPKSAEYRLNLAMLLLNQQRFDEATMVFRESIDLRPTLGPAHFGLGESLLGLKDRAGAKEAFREAARLMPEHALIQQRLKELEDGPEAVHQ